MTTTVEQASRYEAVIGLEVHVELATRTKMFCACAVEVGAEPNSRTCPVCMGQPGSLPVANRTAVEYAIRLGLALGCRIAPVSQFHRKNYFYPDMPKNYQISQYDAPICVGGSLEVPTDAGVRHIGITRVHMEEDTGKTVHVGESGRIHGADYALVDYNRAGIPLLEVVSEPDLRSGEEARAYLAELRAIVLALGISDARLEAGSMRCDANVSLRPVGHTVYGTRVEVKNMNSLRSLGRAIDHEIARQADLLAAGEPVVHETRHWDEDAGVTSTLRTKEEVFDYRYFPDPDLVPVVPEASWVDDIRAGLPELPAVTRARLAELHGLG
ncbi:MAG: Asp-tRNA(Asn)/Glu-tRNA(Gln) amidotransferase subunit GatB, partial [Actinomycetota bacterium]|nr:Asp-tRNA(Asn)/Glu-tRNA(Gln) amidotransferase subunit GatB [Actinomycetota bacterium]